MADGIGGSGRGAEFSDLFAWRDASLREMASLRLRHFAWIDGTECELYGLIAVLLEGADLGDDTRTGFDRGHRDDLVRLIEDLCHAELGAKDPLDRRAMCLSVFHFSGLSR